MTYERQVLLLSLGSGFLGTALALVLLWSGPFGLPTRWTASLFLLLVWLVCALVLRRRIEYTFQTIANLLSALREGDYSIRARGSRGGALDALVHELNALGETLRAQRLEAIEAAALLRKVVEEIDVAVFTFDASGRLTLTNRAGARLLGEPAERLLGRPAADLGLEDCLEGDATRTIERTMPGGARTFQVRRSLFREKGVPHQLIVLTDLSSALREEERSAWQRLVRVLGHELNNSLAPIRSIAQSLTGVLRRPQLPQDFQDDAVRGLGVIGSRAESLTRFLQAFTRLSGLPKPTLRSVAVDDWIRRVAQLETRLAVEVEPGPPVTIHADGDQLDQLLINLVRNAADAALTTRGAVRIGWSRSGEHIEVRIEDEGPGPPPSANLFVPFFTTKPTGSGIGLVLSRQIAEAHGGSLTLAHRPASGGCEARLRLPIAGPSI